MFIKIIFGSVFLFLYAPAFFTVLFFSIIFVLIYLYITSEIIGKQFIVWSLVLLVTLFLAFNIYLGVKSNRDKVEFRLTVFPLQQLAGSSGQNLIASAFWATLNQHLKLATQKKAVIVSPEDVVKFAVFDSLAEMNYISRLNGLIKGDYAAIGNVAQDGQIFFQLINTRKKKVLFSETIQAAGDNIGTESLKIVNKILDHFRFVPHEYNKDLKFVSVESFSIFLNAMELFRKKEFKQARQMAERAIAMDSSLVENYLLVGKTWFMQAIEKRKNGKTGVEHFQNANKWLLKTITKDPLNAEAYAFLGEYHIYRERWSLAEDALLKAFELNPNLPRLYLSISRMHKSRFKKLGYGSEEDLFKKAIYVNPCYEDAYLMLSDYYLFENNRDEAIRVLEKYLNINPNSVPALMALGKIYLVRNDILKIIEVFNRVIKLEPNNSDAYYNLGILYYNSEDYDNSYKFLQRAIAIDNHLNSHLYLAYLYEVRGDIENAIKHLRMRIRYRKGFDDVFAEEARKRLYDLMHPDTSKAGR